MKKISVLLVLSVILTATNLNAQEGFSVKAGLNFLTAKIDFGSAFGGTVSDNETGFYVGGGYNFEISDTFKIEPSVLFSAVNDFNSLYIPIMGQYYFTDEFFAQAGPQINYLLEDVDDGALGIDIAFGGGYNFTENWFIEARYGLEVSRGGNYGEFASFNTLSFGAGYRF